jgi:hypothetical protein
MTEDEKAKFLRERGWSESCLNDGYWNPPQGVKLPPMYPEGKEPQWVTGSGWNMAVASRLVLSTDDAYEYEQKK